MITIVDYQMGNLRSVENALQRLGYPTRITSDAAEIAAAEKLILPGVGGFGDAMTELERRDLVVPLRDFIDSGKPFLGICLGLQLLFETGYEGGTRKGLGVFAGDVVRFDLRPPLKVPHMGWNTVHKTREAPILQDIPEGAHFYFVHSYYVRPAEANVVALECDYGGPFCAMLWRENVYAAQFHPEKSQSDGLKLLGNFAALPQNAPTPARNALG